MDDVRTLPVGEGNEEVKVTLDDLAREGARRMIATACAQTIAEQLHRERIPVEVLDLDPSRDDGYDLTNWLLDYPTRSDALLRETPPGVERQ